MIDCGVNFTDRSFTKDLIKTLRRARLSGILGIIFSPKNLLDSQKYLELIHYVRDAERIPRLFSFVGIHPREAYKECKMFSSLSTQKKIFTMMESRYAVGLSTGLDRNLRDSPLEYQIKLFQLFLRASRTLNKPLALIDHGNHDLFIEIMRQNSDIAQNSAVYDIRRVSTGKINDYLDLKMHISISDKVTYKKFNSSWINLVPREKLLFHSFAPDNNPNSENFGEASKQEISTEKEKLASYRIFSMNNGVWPSQEFISDTSVHNAINFFRLR